MVKTPLYQKRGKCGHFMPQFDPHGSCFGCRAKCKGLDPCAQGADVTECVACSALSEEQWTHLREDFTKRSAYRSHTGSQGDSFKEQDVDEPVCTGEYLSRVDDTLLDLELEVFGSSAPVTCISPLTSLPAPLPASSQNIQSTSVSAGPVNQPYVDPSAFFKAPEPVQQTVPQDTLPPGQVPHTPGGHSIADRKASLSFPQPQRTTTINVPQTARTQMIKSHLEQQNFELMKDLQKKSQEQMRDISAQLQTGLQAFQQQSMEQMFNRMAPPQTAPPPPSTAPHIVSITPVSALRLPPNQRNPWSQLHLIHLRLRRVSRGKRFLSHCHSIYSGSSFKHSSAYIHTFVTTFTAPNSGCYSSAPIPSTGPGTRRVWN